MRNCLLVVAALTLLTPSSADAQAIITRIEEDWEIHIKDPDANEGTPQLLNIISPRDALWGTHFMLELNHTTYPNFANGGLQLQSWLGDEPTDYTSLVNAGKLSTPGEVIHYTITMWVTPENSKVHCEITGHSHEEDDSKKSWGGDFGGNGSFKLSAYTILTNLNQYCRHCSTGNSAICVAAHNVNKFCNCEVRYYSGETLISTDSEEKVLHSYQDLVETDQ